MTGIILDALAFAAKKHRDQRRKDLVASPYVNHLIDVAHLLWHVGGIRDETVLTAAVLHDTLEDTETTPGEIEARFGTVVLGYVQEVTDDKSLTKAERKRLQIVNASKKSAGARLIKIADKSSNLHDILHSPPGDWPVERKYDYFRWAEEVVEGLRGENKALEAHFDALLKTGIAEFKS